MQLRFVLKWKKKKASQQLIDLHMSTPHLEANEEQYRFRTDVLSKNKTKKSPGIQNKNDSN